MRKLIATIELNGLPPTSNHMYTNIPTYVVNGRVIRRGGRCLTKEAKLWKAEMAYAISRDYAFLAKEIVPNVPYEIHITLFFAQGGIFNTTYPKGAKTRYKKVDALNRAKILEDTLAEVFGVDDNHNFVIRLEKRPCKAPRTEIEIWRKEDEWPGNVLTKRNCTRRADLQGSMSTPKQTDKP